MRKIRSISAADLRNESVLENGVSSISFVVVVLVV